MGGCEFQQQIFRILAKDLFDRVLPGFMQGFLRARSDIHMVRFIRDQRHLVLAEIFKSQCIFALGGQIGMQFLDSGEADAYVVGIGRFEIIHLTDTCFAIREVKLWAEEILDGERIEEIIPRFIDDIR